MPTARRIPQSDFEGETLPSILKIHEAESDSEDEDEEDWSL
jgi:hypothetical protein